jgi:hypothetical protein
MINGIWSTGAPYIKISALLFYSTYSDRTIYYLVLKWKEPVCIIYDLIFTS